MGEGEKDAREGRERFEKRGQKRLRKEKEKIGKGKKDGKWKKKMGCVKRVGGDDGEKGKKRLGEGTKMWRGERKKW